MSRPSMTLDRPACLAIRAWLVDNRGTMSEIMAATGYGLSTVEKAVCALRKAGEPEAKNAVTSRVGAPALNAEIREERRLKREKAKEAREEAEFRALQASRVEIVRAALATRTPLEQVWGQQA